METDIKIFISYHKQCYIPQYRYLYPIQVGTENAKELFENMLHDNVGENISKKNPMYCELTAQYWAWKNVDAEYYGFFHYRRYMSFSNKRMKSNQFEDVEIDYLDDESIKQLELEKIPEIIPMHDVIATTPVKLCKLNETTHNNAEQYSLTPYQYQEDIDVLLDIIKEKYPAYYKDAVYYLYKYPYGYFCNMFIMRRDIFFEYSSWLFSILEEHERRRDYSQYSIDGCRISGYLGERLFGIFYFHLKKEKLYRTCELQRTLFRNVQPMEKIEPIFTQNNIPVIIASNDYYAPYISTLLLSIIDASSERNNYDVIILSHDISEANKDILSSYAENNRNFSIRFFDPHRYLQNYKLYTRGHFSIETYYRLILPELLHEYDKVIYIDVDMIVLEDLAKLYAIDIEGYLLAATNDADTVGLYNGYQPGKKEYMDTQMQMKNPYLYFQAGTLIMNLLEFRKKYTTEDILKVAASKEWQLLDQDILNVVCEGKVKYIDMAWNVMYDFTGIRQNQIIRLAPKWLYDMYVKARKAPKIIHYAGSEKPWLYPECDYSDIFWKYAKRTNYYEMMLCRAAQYAAKQELRVMQTEEAKKNRGLLTALYRTMRCLILYGPVHTVQEIMKEIRKW